MSKVFYKSAEDIEQLRKSADVLSQLLGEIAKVIKPGVKTISLDKLAY
ncbi:MAG TPA: type I methionyl aminopeptidase, partial [Sphingobacterium sp.]|nr:type I methionyl aminopeptidase [Sphingobacterium sp.]